MKKLLMLLTSLLLMVGLVGCGSPEEEQPEEQVDYEIALITDAGLIMDGGYSEVAWEAITEFGATQGVSHKYYKAAEASEEAYKEVIDDAVSRGAKVIIADGYLFEDVIYSAQKEYEDVKFILIDAEPVDPQTGETMIAENTAAVMFASEEAGYMAGYAAVEDGISQLGFIGDAENVAMKDYGYGFLQGVDAAAKENGVSVNVKYHYCNGEDDRNAIKDKVTQWYEGGTEAVFACGSEVERPAVEAAELNEKKVILCETDKNDMSDMVITSVIKDISGAVNDILTQYKQGKFPSGQVLKYDTESEDISINMETSRFTSFNESDYKYLYRMLKNKDVKVKDHNVGSMNELGLSNVNLIEE